MRKILSFIFLLLAEIANAQSPAAVVSKQLPGIGYQFVNAKTQLPVDKLIWDEAEVFVNGFARVLHNNKFSFVNISGNLIAPVDFDAARNFSNKLAAVQKDGKWGFINMAGKQVIPFQYEISFDFKETVTVVYANRKWFLINLNGDIIKALDISVFHGFNKGIAVIEKGDQGGTMNTHGEIVFSSQIKPVSPKRNTSSRPPVTPTTTACPDNIDFEYGSFFNWKCFTGSVDSVGNTNVITVSPSAPTNNRHTIYNKVTPSRIDAYGLFPTNPPDGSNFALRLGNTSIGAQAERVSYPIHVPLNDSNFSLKYDYAVVFEDPGHTMWTQPRFTVRLLDSATNTYVDCASFEYISTSNLPGFARSTVDTGVVYKPWSSVYVSLRGHAGKTMYLEFTTADCVRRGHWGYAYVDVEKPCGQSVQLDYECTSPNITTMDGPPGFQFYNWWDSTFSHVYGTGQHVVLNPGPPVNTTIWLEMVPFSNFGCKDTIPVKINGIFNANFIMSDTVGVCAPHSFTFYNTDIPSASATWNFGDGTIGSGDTVTHVYTLPGNYTVTLNVTLPSGCIGTIQKNVSILEPVGSFYFNGAYFCNSQQVRYDAVVNNADSLFWDFGDENLLATTQTTVYHTYAQPGIYLPFLTVQSAFGCKNTLPSPDTIRIEKLIPGFSNTQRKVCGSTIISLTDTSYSFFGITNYEWDFGDGTTGTGHNISHAYTASGTYNIQLIITGTSGCKDTLVKPIPVLVNNIPAVSITGPSSQCSVGLVTFTGNIQSADAVSVSQWNASNGNVGSGNNFTASFDQPGTYTIQLIVGTVNGCYDTATHQIIINAAPAVSQPNDQGLCNGSATNPVHFTGSVNNTVFNWTNNNPSIGLAANGSGDIGSFTAINNSSVPVTATITITPFANSCPGAVKTFIITVNPAANVTQPVNQVLCNNSATAAISFSGSVTNQTYTWTNNDLSIGLAASGTGDIPSFNVVNNTGVPVIASINVRPNSNGCPGPAKLFTITVNPTAGVNQPADQQLCNGTNTNAINFTGSANINSYNWTNDNPAIGLAASGSGNIASFAAINNTTTVLTATITVTPLSNSCPGNPKTFTIKINPAPSMLQPNNQIVCKNSPVTGIVFSSNLAGTVYTWTNNNTAIGLAATGTGDISSFNAINNTAQSLVATITVTSSTNGCTGPGKVFTITVNPVPNMAQPADQSLCNGSLTSAINFTGAAANSTYSWTNDNPLIGLPASGSGNIAAFTAINNTALPVTATITVSPSSSVCPGTSATFTITVNPSANVAQPGNQVLCRNEATSAISFTGFVAATMYNWTNDNPSIGLAAIGNGDISSFTAINNTNQPVIATITVIATANGCISPGRAFTITVNPLPVITQPVNQVYCNGIITNAIAFISTVNGTTFNWTNDNPSIGLPASGTGDISSFAAVNNTALPVTATITVSATAGSCPAAPKTFTITINPGADLAQPASQVLCNGSLSTTVNFSGNITTATFNWVNDNPSIGLAASGSGDIPAFTSINNSGIPVTATITVTAMANGCPGQVKTFTITINPTPDVAQPLNQVLCNGSTFTGINFTGSVNNTVFNWTNNNPSIGLAANGSGDINPFIVVNTGNAPVVATITVLPAGTGCSGIFKTFTITVNPTPAFTKPADQIVCNGSLTTALALAGTVNGTVYNWSNNNTSIGLAASGQNNIPAFMGDNNSTAYDTAVISITPSANSCPGQAKNFMIIVKPSPNIIQPDNQALCDRALSAPITFTATLTGATLGWTNNNTAIGLAASGTGNIHSFPVTNTTDAALIALINVTASANGCIGPVKTAVITVHPTPKIVASNNMEVCLGRPTQLSATGGAQYSWTPANMLSCTSCSNPVATPSDSIRYIVQGTSAAGCIAYDSVSLRVIKPFRMQIAPGDSLCAGESAGLHAMHANTYLWSPPAGLNSTTIADPTATPQVTTNYTVVGFDGHHCFTDTAHVTIVVGPKPGVEIGQDISTQTGTTLTLQPSIQNGPIVKWLWSPATNLSCTDCPNPVASVTNNITYEVTVTNNFGCTARDRVSINVFCQKAQVFIPNAFTPDGDGLNDILMIRGSGISIKSFRIFSRWGELVFEKTNFNPNDPKYGWDGKIRGVPATPDVFVYTAEVICDNGITYVYKGNTTVLK